MERITIINRKQFLDRNERQILDPVAVFEIFSSESVISQQEHAERDFWSYYDLWHSHCEKQQPPWPLGPELTFISGFLQTNVF